MLNNSVPTSLLKFWALTTQASLCKAMPSYIQNVFCHSGKYWDWGCRVNHWHKITCRSKKFWDNFKSLLSLIRHGPLRKWCVPQFYCCVCIRCRRQFFTEKLPTNDKGFSLSRCLASIREYTYRHRLMRGIYEVWRWDGIRCHDVHTRFLKDWFRHSKVTAGQVYIDSMEIARAYFRKAGKRNKGSHYFYSSRSCVKLFTYATLRPG
jgi:hypothetical protein